MKESDYEQAILEAAEQLFMERGYELTSTTQIAKVVGCNQALVHYYFRSKKNLFYKIFKKKFEAFAESLFELDLKGSDTFENKIKKVTEAHFDLLSKNCRMVTLFLSELTRDENYLSSFKELAGAQSFKIIMSLKSEFESEQAAKRIKENISFSDLIITLLSTNLSLFILMPTVRQLLDLGTEESAQLINSRKKHNVEIVLSYLGYR